MTVQKKRGRPAKTVTATISKGTSRVNTKPTVESVMAEWERRYTDMLDYYDKHLAAAHTKIANLEHQAIGYRSVISYLESKVEQLIANSVRGN